MKNKAPFAPRRYRRVVLKRSIRQDENLNDLITEMDQLRVFRGHSHIGQLIDSTPDVSYLRPRAGRIAAVARRLFGKIENPPENIFKTLSYIRGPGIILEYLENGSLANFQQKLEEITADGGFLHPLEHRDIAARNLMIGECEPTVPEHHLIHKLILIDFGVAEYANNAYLAQRGNMFQIARAIISLIIVDLRLGLAERIDDYNGIRTRAGTILPENGVDPFPRLDPDLRNLLVRMLNRFEGQRPDLAQVLEETRLGMMKDASAYPGNRHETDEYIQFFLQEFLHNA
ncbi:hypothetical protein CHU98_g4010 [Xylaria longipes]|nr:hypothetical protein CHU98_g4010 [Xylaria longipes]